MQVPQLHPIHRWWKGFSAHLLVVESNADVGRREPRANYRWQIAPDYRKKAKAHEANATKRTREQTTDGG